MSHVQNRKTKSQFTVLLILLVGASQLNLVAFDELARLKKERKKKKKQRLGIVLCHPDIYAEYFFKSLTMVSLSTSVNIV